MLTPQETDKLFAVMRNMKADGKSLIIITHKLHEVLDVSDRVAVLRKGEYIGDVLTKDADQQSLTDMMVGHSVSLNINRPTPVNVEPRLKIEGLSAPGARVPAFSWTAKILRRWHSASGRSWRSSPPARISRYAVCPAVTCRRSWWAARSPSSPPC